MNSLSARTLAAHFPAVAPEIFRVLENEKSLAAGTAKDKEGKSSINMLQDMYQIRKKSQDGERTPESEQEIDT